MALTALMEKQKIQKKAGGDKVFNTETMLAISEIRGNAILLKDLGIRGILRVTGLNLDLKNSEEQQIVIEQYKRFLNGLDFPIQILMRSAYLDLSMYLNYMKAKVSHIDNDVLKDQGEHYIKFLDDIDAKQGLVYVKEFYIIVPYYESGQDNENVNKPRWSKLLSAFDSKDSAEKIVARYRSFVKSKSFLDTRCNLIADGLRSMGMSSERLEMSEIISLIFKMYNPNLHSAQAEFEQTL